MYIAYIMTFKDKEARKEYNRKYYLERRQPKPLQSIEMNLEDCYSQKEEEQIGENPLHKSNEMLKNELENLKREITKLNETINDYKKQLEEKDELIYDQEEELQKIKHELGVEKVLNSRLSFLRNMVIGSGLKLNVENYVKKISKGMVISDKLEDVLK